MSNPTSAPQEGVEYIALESMTPFERKVFDLALDALALPLTERQLWFRLVAEAAMVALEARPELTNAELDALAKTIGVRRR